MKNLKKCKSAILFAQILMILMILKSQIPQVGDFIRSDLGFWGNLEILINFTFLSGFVPAEGGGVCDFKVESQMHVWNI